jgi:hypothetical protein
VESESDLSDDEYFPRGAGPAEYIELNCRYDEMLDRLFADLLRELGATDLGKRFLEDQAEFDRARERGRRTLFHKDDTAAAVDDIVRRYEREAIAAAEAKAYTAAIILVGAALEGTLLLRCLLSEKLAIEVASSLPKVSRPKSVERLQRWTFGNLIDVCHVARWLPAISTRLADYSPNALAHELRALRNFVHPGRLTEERPWIESDKREYEYSVAIFETLRQTLGGTRDRGNIASVAARNLRSDGELSAIGLEKLPPTA